MTILEALRIPRMGSVENARLVTWRVAEGVRFAAGEVVCEVETDKTLTDIEAEADGVLAKHLAAEGDELKVGDLIGLTAAVGASAAEIAHALAEREEPLAAAQSSVPAGAQATESALAAAPSSRSGESTASAGERLSPLVRRLAREHGVELSRVSGTGPGGRITGDDVLRAAGGAPLVPGYDGIPVEARPHSTRRRAIARRLAESVRVAPHLTADMQVDLSVLYAERERGNAARRAVGEPPISLLSYIAHATAQLLPRHPDLNATHTESHQLRWQVVNLGIAVDTADGLVVPVIRGAETLSLAEIHAAIERLAASARAGSLAAAELEGGTFTLSNPGALGPVLRAEAILNPPQVALLGLPGILRAPVAVETSPGEWQVEVRPLIRPSLTFDHRALDGGPVIRFLNDLKAVLERP
jgi:pyruvate/2-oxoglutarate dehydrogenase complex dihydrolipoamide acyltransferase (E2) component